MVEHLLKVPKTLGSSLTQQNKTKENIKPRMLLCHEFPSSVLAIDVVLMSMTI
jgi:hypothetical protein